MKRICALVLGLILVAACQPLPQPFANDRPQPGAPILTLRDGAGVQVMPVAGAGPGVGAELAEAMAEELRKAEIPASTTGRNRNSYVLVGQAITKPIASDRTAVEIRWEMHEADGKQAGVEIARAEARAADWAKPTADLLRALVRQPAPRLAALLQDDAPVQAPDADGPTVIVRPVTGAPGDGTRSLARAMGSALRQSRVKIAADPSTGRELVLAGQVLIEKPAQGLQKIKITWTLQRLDGASIGTVSQENAIPAGSLDGAWGDIAYAVANAAVDGVTALLDKVKSVAAGS